MPTKTLNTVADLFEGASVRTYKGGQLILHQGDTLTQVYCLVKGYIKIYDILDSGDKRIINLHAPGDAFPLTTFLTSKKRTIRYYYETMGEVRVKMMTWEQFAKLLDAHPKAFHILLDYFAGGYRRITAQLEAIENKKAIDKVTRIWPYLVERSGKLINPNTYKLQLKLTHQDVADLTGLTRETVSMQIKILERRGLLEQRHGYFYINKKIAK